MTRARGKTPSETPDETGPDNEDGARPLFGGEVREDNHVAVFRMDDRSMKWEYCAKMATDITEDTLKERGGGGLYKCVERGPGPNGRGIVYVQQVRVKISGAPLPWKDLPGDRIGSESPVPGMATVPAAAGGITMNDILVQSVLDMQRQSREAAEQSARAAREHSEAMMTLMKRDTSDPRTEKMFDLMMARMMAPPPPPPDNSALVLKLIEAIGERNAPTPAPSMLEQMDVMEKLLDLKMKAKELLSGDGGDEGEDSSDPITMLARALLPSLMSAGGAPPAAPAPPRLPASTTPAAPPAQGTEVASPMWLMQFNRLKPPLLAWAKEGKDPFKVADHLLEFMVPPNMKGGLREFMSDPEAVNKLLAAWPELQPFAKWTSDVMSAIHELLFPELYDDEGELLTAGAPDLTVEDLSGSVEGEVTT